MTMCEPRTHSVSTKGPEPTGFSAKAWAFSSSVVAGHGFEERLGHDGGVEHGQRGRQMHGSGRFRLRTTWLSPTASTLSTDSSEKLQMPFSGLRARSSDQTTSSGVMSEPSANLMPSRRVTVKDRPSSETS